MREKAQARWQGACFHAVLGPEHGPFTTGLLGRKRATPHRLPKEPSLSVEVISRILKAHPLMRDVSEEHRRVLAGHAQSRVYQAGEYLRRQGQEGDSLILIDSGEVVLEISIPNQGPMPVDTSFAGEAVGGWCWLAPSYRWPLDARALTVVNALVLDGKHVREACEQDAGLGYRLLKRLTLALGRSLDKARLRCIEHGTVRSEDRPL